MMPIPPNLSKIPARIIEPNTGASTWAIGNQRWREYRGSFTINASSIIMERALEELPNPMEVCL